MKKSIVPGDFERPKSLENYEKLFSGNYFCNNFVSEDTLSQGQIQVLSSFYTMEAQFVPGTNPVCPWDNPGDKGQHKKFRC